MINSQFSERAFEIYVNHFIISRGYRIYIPSQNREARLGYDGLINNIKGQKFKAFAMQFKIIQKYQRKPACGHCFNFYLHNYNRYRQHNRLVKLNNSNILAGYVVPYFVGWGDLFNNVNNGQLLSQAMFISPGGRINDTRSHYISFNKTSAVRHSKDWAEVRVSPLDELIDRVEESDDFIVSDKGLLDKLYIFDEWDEGNIKNRMSAGENGVFVLAYKLIPDNE